MANELDKTIEELEAEVIAELEEGAHDAPKKGATAAEPMKKKPADGATGEEDIGGSTPSKVTPPTGKSASLPITGLIAVNLLGEPLPPKYTKAVLADASIFSSLSLVPLSP